MNVNKRIQLAKWGYLLLSMMLIVLGTITAAMPDISASWICRVCGIFMLIFGGVKLIGYFAKDLYRLAFQHDLAFGILLIALGSVMIFHTNSMLVILYTILGVYILIDALLKIQTAMDAKIFGLPKWWMILLSAIITGIVGFLLILRPSESAEVLTTLLGISLITEGIMNLITILVAVKITRNYVPRIIDAEGYEV